jgi:hypothetical protein
VTIEGLAAFGDGAQVARGDEKRSNWSMALTWPNGKKIAVSVTVMFETWSEGHAPNYSVQTPI